MKVNVATVLSIVAIAINIKTLYNLRKIKKEIKPHKRPRSIGGH